MASVACSRRCACLFGTRFVLSNFRISRGTFSEALVRSMSSNKQSAIKVDKSLLSQLRRETGFGFAKCKESLQLNSNDFKAAVAWLETEAEKQGWEKATKLQERAVSEGLVGVLVDGNNAAMVEVNCETDFVARNELFVELVSSVANAAILKRKKIVDQTQKINALGGEIEHLKEVIPEHKLQNEELKNGIGETVRDAVTRTIGKLGENVKITKAVTMTTKVNNVIGRYVHGGFVTSSGGCSMGKFGGMVVLRPKRDQANETSMLSLANKLAQHVVGMNPKVIEAESAKEGDVSDVLLEQEYLLDESQTVKDLLNKEDVEVVDFVRYECGA
ncbi:elongation factor Ts, mitochondrial-like [Montipora capricornis]|uniref:elongation factor Ts, mitochondrial-like n=1 Tax=Montipora capricornis TaxID=246305 RepID=UPI0035F13940